MNSRFQTGLAKTLLRRRNENQAEMKMLMIMGAIIGFSLGLALGFANRADWPSTLLRACAAAAAVGLLMRWWGRVWLQSLKASLRERRLAEASARQQTPSSTPAKK